MRPEIEGALEERVKRAYKEAGYGTASELVRDAVRNHLNRIEAQQYTEERVDRPFFKYRIFPSEDHPTELRLFPKEGSLQYEPFEEGEPPHTVVFDTGISYIGAHEIEDEIEQISGVEHVEISTSTGQIRVYEDQDAPHDSDMEKLVNQIYETLSKLFAEFDRRIEEGELTRQESYQRSISSYWEAAREGTE